MNSYRSEGIPLAALLVPGRDGAGAGPDSRVVGVVVGGFVLGPWSRPGPDKKKERLLFVLEK